MTYRMNLEVERARVRRAVYEAQKEGNERLVAALAETLARLNTLLS